MLKKALSVFAATVLAALCLPFVQLPAKAAVQTEASLKTFRYLPESQGFSPQSIFNAGDKVYVAVSFTAIPSLGGVMFDLNYDTSALSHYAAGCRSVIIGGNADTMFTDRGNFVRVIWETESDSTAVDGTAFYIAFEVKKDFTQSKDCNFSLDVREVFDGSSAQNDIGFSVSGLVSVTFNPVYIPQELLDLAGSLSQVVYNPQNESGIGTDSLANIARVEALYVAMTPVQQETLYKNYRQLYDNISTARTRYYRLAEQNALALIQQEVDKFAQDYAYILGLTSTTLKFSDKTSLETALSSYGLLSSQAKAKVSQQHKDTLNALNIRMTQLKAADAAEAEALVEAQEYNDAYAYLMKDIYLQTAAENYQDLTPRIGEALMVYGLLSDTAKVKVDNLYKRLLKLEELVNEALSKNADEKAVQNKIAEFQRQWQYVLALNGDNVSLGDEAAIGMAFEAWDNLQDVTVKARLAYRFQNLESLLEVIEVIKTADPVNGGEEVEKIVEVEKVVEKVVDRVVEKVVEKVVGKPVDKLVIRESGFDTPLYLILIFLAVSTGVLIATCWLWTKNKISE